MKNAIIIFIIFCVPLFFSCSNSNGNKYIGNWTELEHKKDKLIITKDGDNYFIKSEGSWVKGGSFTYKLKEGTLEGDGNLGKINYVESSGHLTWQGVEWGKISDNTESELATSQKKTSEYNFGKHDDFNIFWTDFKKAVIAGDKDAVAKMTKFPFKDNRSNSGPDVKLFTSKTSADFINRYNEIFSPAVIKQIDTGKYSQSIAYDGDPGNDNQQKIPDSYSLLVHLEAVNGWGAEFVFKKINGEYKLTDIPYAE